MGLVEDLQFPPTGTTLGLEPTSLAVILRYVFPIGKAHPLITYGIVEDRAVVRIGIRGGIVTIEVQRARIVTIVSVAQTNSTTQSADEGSTCFQKSDAKLLCFFVTSKSKSDYLCNLD